MVSKRPLPATPARNQEASQAALLSQIEQALDGINRGSIEVVVHEGKVVQIERRQRVYGPDKTQAVSALP